MFKPFRPFYLKFNQVGLNVKKKKTKKPVFKRLYQVFINNYKGLYV